MIVSPFGFLPHHAAFASHRTASIPHLHRVTFRAASASKSGAGADAKVKQPKGETITVHLYFFIKIYAYIYMYVFLENLVKSLT